MRFRLFELGVIGVFVVIFAVLMSSPIGTGNRVPTEPPRFLTDQFREIDWATADPAVFRAVSGGPPRDGIPSLDDPEFVPLRQVSWGDAIQAVVLEDEMGSVRVYPYNVLVWHEIVNDTIAGVPIAVTFCPLCGSAIVFERTLPNGAVTTFGVSGGLIESNMIMFDRETEGLWQQSTGRSLAGPFVGVELELHPFQLLTLGEVRASHPGALILSADTGFPRDYDNNPYGDYDESDHFLFAPSTVDDRYPAKAIMAAFVLDERRVAVPWQELRDAGTLTAEIHGAAVSLTVTDGELSIRLADGSTLPFYFEMWFSWSVQNLPAGIILDPDTCSRAPCVIAVDR